MVEKQWWRREREREKCRKRERIRYQTFLGLEISLECNK